MNTMSARQAATVAGTSVPRLLRAAQALGFDAAADGQPRRKRQFAPAQVRALVARLARPAPAPIPGLSMSEARVLAVLAGAPLGLNSARAVARATGLSPATATAALGRLTARGLVLRQTQIVAEAGARKRDVLLVDVCHPDWASLAPHLTAFRATGSPSSGGRQRQQGGVPARLAHVFWNENLRTLDPDRHGQLIAKRILQAKDPQALAWAADRLGRTDWERAAQTRALDPRDAALARALAHAARRRGTS